MSLPSKCIQLPLHVVEDCPDLHNENKYTYGNHYPDKSDNYEDRINESKEKYNKMKEYEKQLASQNKLGNLGSGSLGGGYDIPTPKGTLTGRLEAIVEDMFSFLGSVNRVNDKLMGPRPSFKSNIKEVTPPTTSVEGLLNRVEELVKDIREGLNLTEERV